jgi:hypothetical protein
MSIETGCLLTAVIFAGHIDLIGFFAVDAFVVFD